MLLFCPSCVINHLAGSTKTPATQMPESPTNQGVGKREGGGCQELVGDVDGKNPVNSPVELG